MTHQQITSILVQQQKLTDAQRDTLLEHLGAGSDNTPLLATAAEHFGLNEIDLLDALADHLRRSADRVNLSQTPHDPASLAHLSARDAWDYLVLPLTIEPDGHLLCCTTEETLPTALVFLMRTLAVPFRVVLADIRPIEQYIAEQYHYEGIDLDVDAA